MDTEEDIEHILLTCDALNTQRDKMKLFSMEFVRNKNRIKTIVNKYLSSYNQLQCQFLLDYSVLPDIILATQIYGKGILDDLFHVTRTFCYGLHRERLKLRGR